MTSSAPPQPGRDRAFAHERGEPEAARWQFDAGSPSTFAGRIRGRVYTALGTSSASAINASSRNAPLLDRRHPALPPQQSSACNSPYQSIQGISCSSATLSNGTLYVGGGAVLVRPRSARHVLWQITPAIPRWATTTGRAPRRRRSRTSHRELRRLPAGPRGSPSVDLASQALTATVANAVLPARWARHWSFGARHLGPRIFVTTGTATAPTSALRQCHRRADATSLAVLDSWQNPADPMADLDFGATQPCSPMRGEC